MKDNKIIGSYGPFSEYFHTIKSKDQQLMTIWLQKIKRNLLILAIPEAIINLAVLLISLPIISADLSAARLCSFDLFFACILGLLQCFLSLLRISVALLYSLRQTTRNGLTIYLNISIPSWYLHLVLLLSSAIYSTYMLLTTSGTCRESYPQQYGFAFLYNCITGFAVCLVWGAGLLYFFGDWGCKKEPSLVPTTC